jgi:hypothetical protein
MTFSSASMSRRWREREVAVVERVLENETEPGVQIDGDEEDRRRVDQIRSRALPAREYLEVRRVFPFPRRF